MKRRKPLKRTPLKRKPRRNGRPDIVAGWLAGRPRVCWNCGAMESPWTHIDLHHILGGRFGRVDDPANFSLLCGGVGGVCHRLAEGERVKDHEGMVIPYLELKHVLWLKQLLDPKFFDINRLQEIAGKYILPKPEEPYGWN